MSNSSLICYTNLSPNCSSPRNHSIDTIAIHCMAGHLSLSSCGNLFAKSSTQASSNYGINDDGEIGMFVEECDRSWATSSREVDNRAVTIEVASDASGDCWVTDAALASTITLCADICKRNGIKKLVWKNNKSDRINRVDGANMMVHRDYAQKSCPGDYLYSKMGYIADEVNKILVTEDKPVTVNLIVDGYDYSVVYDYDYYVAHNKDVIDYYGDDKQAVFNHFLKRGMIEARQAIESFNVKIYRDNYEDLRKAFDKDIPKYYQHYIKYGKKENRVTTYHIVPTSFYDGVEYCAVFDADYYIAKYPDLQKAYGNEKDKYDKLIYHFVTWGMKAKERRQAKPEFNVDIYKGNYQDLQIAYGDDYPSYYLHYIKWGQKEGRVADHAIRKVEVKYHTFQNGDTLSKIATQYKTTVDEILKLNNFKWEAGQKIRVQ